MKRVVQSAAEAVAAIPDGASIIVGGFGLCGIPEPRNFNPLMATAAAVTIAEVEHLVEPGEIVS